MPHKIQIFQVELKSNQQNKVGTKLLRANPKNGIQLYSLNFASNYLYQICPNAIFLISGVYVIIFLILQEFWLLIIILHGLSYKQNSSNCTHT